MNLRVRSEYWITGGSKNDVGLLCADEDLPVPNHEGHVWAYMLQRLSEAVQESDLDVAITDTWYEQYGCDIAMFRQLLIDAFDARGEYDIDEMDWALDLLDLSEEEKEGWRGCLRVSNYEDPREFAIKHWGWIRVRWHNAELPDLRAATLKRTAEGFLDIWEEEGGEPDEIDMEREVTVSLHEGTRKSVTLNKLMDGCWQGDLADHDDLTKAGRKAADLLDVTMIPEFYAGQSGG